LKSFRRVRHSNHHGNLSTLITNQHAAAAAIVDFTSEDVKEDSSSSERSKEGDDYGIGETTALMIQIMSQKRKSDVATSVLKEMQLILLPKNDKRKSYCWPKVGTLK
jgi:hypothetical protein